MTRRAALVAKDAAWREVQLDRMATTGEVGFLDEELDAAYMDLARAVMVQVGGRRDDAVYRGLFAEAPSATVKPVASEGQARAVRRVIATLRGGGVYAALAGHADALDARLTALDAAVARRDALLTAEAAAGHERALALEEARRVFNRVRPQLELLLEGRSGLIGSFFA
ncbi:MAG: hypothetical protein H6706_14610 [Myxococcales bacterium]|nr:hypothetical protein [Myxococcales bacterium]